MKKLIPTILLAYLCIAIQAQTTIIDQDFSTATVTIAPLEWTVVTATGDALTDLWYFDNPGWRQPCYL